MLAERRSTLLVERIAALGQAVAEVRARHPFAVLAWAVLPDHLHMIWRMPAGERDFALRWRLIKGRFSRSLPASPARRRLRPGERGIWQRRYWEHRIRDERDLAAHVDYIHYNPVKHRLVARVRDWPHSSFHAYVRRGWLPPDWGGDQGTPDGRFGEAP